MSLPIALAYLALALATVVLFRRHRSVSLAAAGGAGAGGQLRERFEAERERRRSAESGWRESEAKYRNLFDLELIGVVLADFSGGLVEVNDAYLSMLGYTRADFEAGRLRWDQLTVPEHLERDARAIEEARTRGRCRPYEKEYLHRDGHRVPVLIAMATVRGSRSLGHAYIVDLSDREKVQVQLRLSESRLAAALSAADMGCWEIAIGDGPRAVTTSLEMRRLYGLELDRAEVSGERIQQAIHPDDRARAVAEFREAERRFERFRHEYRVVRADGSQRWVAVCGEFLRPAAGQPPIASGVVMDITAQRETTDRLRELADAMPQIVWSSDANGKRDYLNRRWYEMTGSDSEDTRRSVHPEDREKLAAAWAESVTTGRAFQAEYRVRDARTGDYRWHLGRAIPIRDADGKVMRWYGTATDIDEQKLNSERLRLRTEELARSNADLEQFAYVASHDLKEPLRMISSYVQLLRRKYGEALDDQAHEYIDFAVEGTERMQALIHDLLAYSRIGREGAPPEPTDLNEIADRVRRQYAGLLAETGGELVIGPLPTLDFVGSQAFQLLQNLIGNALKFRHPDRPPRVSLSAEKQPDGFWRFQLKDNGIGIDPAFREKVFVIFQRLHGRAQYPGTGIGLSICKKIVEHHGGRIWVESRPGEGSTFCFSLPER